MTEKIRSYGWVALGVAAVFMQVYWYIWIAKKSNERNKKAAKKRK